MAYDAQRRSSESPGVGGGVQGAIWLKKKRKGKEKKKEKTPLKKKKVAAIENTQRPSCLKHE